ncbi:MAG: hypothetical protein ACKV2T_29740 [Kofleriaceae bacterium]
MSTSKRVETPVFVIEEGVLVKERAGARTNVVFTAKAARQIECAFELSDVRLLMFDKAGHFVGRRSSQRSRNVLANRAYWVHEVPTDQLAYASRIEYEIEYRYDVTRKLVGGELPALAAESDSTEWFRWLSIDPRSLDDRSAKYYFTLWARPSDIVFTYGFEPKVRTETFDTRFELDLLDAERNVVLTRNHFLGQFMGGRNYDESDIYNIDRKTMRSLKFYELRARSDIRTVAGLELTL